MTRAEAIIRDVCREHHLAVREVIGRRGYPRQTVPPR